MNNILYLSDNDTLPMYQQKSNGSENRMAENTFHSCKLSGQNRKDSSVYLAVLTSKVSHKFQE